MTIRLAAPSDSVREEEDKVEGEPLLVGRREVIAQELTKSRKMVRIHESNDWKRSTQL